MDYIELVIWKQSKGGGTHGRKYFRVRKSVKLPNVVDNVLKVRSEWTVFGLQSQDVAHFKAWDRFGYIFGTVLQQTRAENYATRSPSLTKLACNLSLWSLQSTNGGLGARHESILNTNALICCWKSARPVGASWPRNESRLKVTWDKNSHCDI